MSVNWGEAAAIAGPAAVGFIGNERTNHANAKMAARQMAFQERMASTQWQRGVKDMEAAGLNPALAYEKGGNSAPSGAMATMEDSMSRGLSSGQEAAALRSRLMSDQAQRLTMAAQADAAASQSKLTQEQAETQRMHRMAQLQLIKAQGESQRFSAERTAQLTPYEAQMMGTQIKNLWLGQKAWPEEMELLRQQTRLTGASARNVEQQIGLTERMTPDEWSANIQRNYAPLISSATDLLQGVTYRGRLMRPLR